MGEREREYGRERVRIAWESECGRESGSERVSERECARECV